MSFVISQLHSVRFRPVDGNNPNFDNTFLEDEKFYNDKIFTFCQRFPNDTTQLIQIKSTSSTLPTVTATEADQSTTPITPTGSTFVSRYDTTGDGSFDTWYFEFDIDFSSFTTKTFITVVQDATTWRSEPFKGDSEVTTEIANGEILKLEYYNQDNNFQIDFSTGITFELYVESILKDYDSGGEISDYDNQDEITKLKETVQRLLTFKTLEIPRYVAEILKLASATDNFVINDVSYQRREQPDFTPVEGSNFVEYSMILTDKEYLGINSHDPGFSCDVAPTDAEFMVQTDVAVSGSRTFTITAGYLLHSMAQKWVSGASVGIKLGTSVGGSQLMNERFISTGSPKRTTNIEEVINRASDQDVYVTVTGGTAKIDILSIQHKETGT